ncbi:transglutaminase-like domain-containing protein [Haloimpatiens sp. FM7315]|uniref:transglutaminase-like domain-containing protein n=1 Tax=Haloimpatiens sp. FM7315 TaxID=3298609 RepID=UPI00370B3481
MKKKSFKIVFLILLLAISIFFINKYALVSNKTNEVSVEKWNNFYNGDNIRFYYQDLKDINIQQLNSNYKINELVKNKKSDFDKAVMLMEWLQNKLKYSKGSMKSEGYAMDIINEAKESGKTINDDDFCSVYAELAASAGLNVRKGEFRVKNSYKEKKGFNHFVCEIWSDKYNKWIIMDPSYNHYIIYNNIPLSSVEIIQKGSDEVKIIGGKNAKKYIDEVKKYFYSYSIAIDNSIYGVKHSNSYVTYLKSGEIPEIYINKSLVSPTIFTNNDKLFGISPSVKYKDNKSDELPTLILSQKKKEDDDDKNKNKIEFYCGVFKNSVMEEKYYISINDKAYKEVNKYFDFSLEKGRNLIKLSTDKNKVEREILINYLKDN